jgi:exodeoxyribonuclease VII large subunit
VQVVVIARGGGSLERMQPFNTLEIAKAIYSSKIPVMTAIGHELDVTIADLVADVRASVPMDAGSRLAEQWNKAADRIDTIEGNIISSFKNECKELELRLSNFSTNFISCYAKHFSQSQKQINFYQTNLTRCFRDILMKIKRVEENFNYNYERFSAKLTNNKRTINAMEKGMIREANRFFTNLDANSSIIEEQFAHNYTRLHRYLVSLNNDIGLYEKGIEREARGWYLAVVKKLPTARECCLPVIHSSN